MSAFNQAYGTWAELDAQWSQLRGDDLALALSDAQDNLDRVWHAATLRQLGFDEQRAVRRAIDWNEVFITNVMIVLDRHGDLDVTRQEAAWLAGRMIDGAQPAMAVTEARALIELRRRAC